MKKSMRTFIKSLSKKNDSLEKIIESKYRKFIWFYWTVQEFSDIISDMDYEPTDDDKILKVSLSFNKSADCDIAYKKISDKKNDMMQISKSKKNLLITLEQDEESLP